MYYIKEMCCMCLKKNKRLSRFSDYNSETNLTYLSLLMSLIPQLRKTRLNIFKYICKACCKILEIIYKYRKNCLIQIRVYEKYISQISADTDRAGAICICLDDIDCNMYETNNIRNIYTEQGEISDISSEGEAEKLYVRLCNNVCEMGDDSCGSGQSNINNNIEAVYVSSNVKQENKINSNGNEPMFCQSQSDRNQHSNNSHTYLGNVSSAEDVTNITKSGNCNRNSDSDISYDAEGEGISYENDFDDEEEDFTLSLDLDAIDTDTEDMCSVSGDNEQTCSNPVMDVEFDQQTQQRSKRSDIFLENFENFVNSRLHSTCDYANYVLESEASISDAEDEYRAISPETSVTVNMDQSADVQTEGITVKHEESGCSHTGKRYSRTRKKSGSFSKDGRAGEKNYCGKCTRNISDGNSSGQICTTLSEHIKKSKQIVAPKKLYECLVCHKKFKWSSSFNRHILTHTKDKSREHKICQKRYKCFICKKKFRYSHNLGVHSRIHTGKRPFKCGLCNKRFTQKNPLVYHMYAHSRANVDSICECKEKISQEILTGFIKKNISIT